MAESKSIKRALAAATCALLGGNLPGPVDAQEDDGWDINTALLYYGEDNGRVEDYSVSVLAQRTYVDDRYMTIGVTVDALTGATPSGAIRQGVPQTFTRPSGAAAYSIQAGSLPLDDTFRDTRLAVTANWQQPLERLYTVNVGASASKEYDYLHLGVYGQISRDFNNRNTTLSVGLALAFDELEPVGGTPAPFTSMLDVGNVSNRVSSTESKDVIDAVIGVTQVVSRNLLVQANYSYSNASGYLTDPYKILSLVDPVSGDTVLRGPGPGPGGGPSHEFLFESRPDERTKHSFYVQGKYYMDGPVIDVSYRYMTDDWDIDSHTAEVRFRWPLGDSSYIQPHLRYYTQTEAEFWQLSLVNGTPLPVYASADYRLGNFDAITVGLKYGWETANGNEMSVRGELYQQSGVVPDGQIIGNQAGRENFPDLDAVILQFSYQFDL